MNKLGKLLLVCTSLAPVLGAFAVNDLVDGRAWYWVGAWIGSACGLTILCVLLLWFVRRHGQNITLNIRSVSLSDKEVLAYLISYLLPIIAKNTFDVRANPWTTMFVFAMVILVVYHGNAFHFNPLLSMVGYHFYEVETEGKMKYILVSPLTIRRQEFQAQVKVISDYVFLEVGAE